MARRYVRTWDRAPGRVTLTLDVEFESTGYDDPGIAHLPPEMCFPPDSDEERRITGVRVDEVEANDLIEALEACEEVMRAVRRQPLDTRSHESWRLV
jgi:hypothetical protein